MLAGRFVVSVAVILGGCGDDGAGPVDAPLVPVDIDNGSCGDQLRFTGEYVDWDTESSFCGINNALIEVIGGSMDSTAPNGRFDLCIPDAPATRLDITQPTAMSQCTVPPSTYTIPTILFAQKAVIQSGAMFSGRAWTVARQTSLFTMVGAAFDPTKAQVFVNIDGTARAATLGATHGTAQAVVGSAWAAGNSGEAIFFPNVDVGTGTTTLTVPSSVGGGSIPLVAGTITNVTVKGN